MIKTTFLELLDASELRPPKPTPMVRDISIKKIGCPVACAALYSAVGKSQYWNIYRWGWTENHWRAHLQQLEIEVWGVYKGDSPIGYFELQVHPDSSVQIVYLGILEEHTGKGIGGHVLTFAVRRGLKLGPSGVWLHTCSLDHPAALKNYYARGFKFIREEPLSQLLLDDMPELEVCAASTATHHPC